MRKESDSEKIVTFRKIIGKKIKHARRIRGITQEQLADMIGTQHTTISKIETGKLLSLVNLVDIVDVLSLDIDVKPNGGWRRII